MKAYSLDLRGKMLLAYQDINPANKHQLHPLSFLSTC